MRYFENLLLSSIFCIHFPPTPICSNNNQLLLAQIISVVALILSLAGWFLAWIAGIIAVIILWLACCMPLPRMAWVAVAVLSAIAALGELLVLIGVVEGSVYCGGEGCGGRVGTIIIGIIALISWLLVGTLSCRQGEGAGKTCNDLPR
jgi:hypothetical protein